MHSRDERKGYTLVEMLIVLIVVASIMALTIFVMGNLRSHKGVNERFFTAVEAGFSETVLYSQQNHCESHVYFIPHDDVVFETVTKGQRRTKRIKQPALLSVVDYHDVTIKKNGYVKPQTINWYDQDQKKRISQKIQLGWGSYRLSQ